MPAVRKALRWTSSRGPRIMSGFCCISLDVGTREKVSGVREVVEITGDLHIVRQSQSCPFANDS